MCMCLSPKHAHTMKHTQTHVYINTPKHTYTKKHTKTFIGMNFDYVWINLK